MDKDRERNRKNVGGKRARTRETGLRAHTRVEPWGDQLRRHTIMT